MYIVGYRLLGESRGLRLFLCIHVILAFFTPLIILSLLSVPFSS